MVFSSHIFCFYFLPVFLGLYYATPRAWRNAFLTIASYIFYGWANPSFVFLMFGSTLLDYACGLVISGQPFFGKGEMPVLDPKGPRTGRQKSVLAVSIAVNLSILAFFKYFNFGIDTYNDIAARMGLTEIDGVFRVVLPLGISFYTFQSMSYIIDVYRGDARAIRRFTDFACYVAMFPQLVAGPIIRFQDVSDQLSTRRHTWEHFARGVSFFSLGMAKKILLANPCGKVADTVFNAGSAGILDAWEGLFAYSFQIYFDFSGYSDMAIGLGLMIGFVFPKNFDSPYISRSITEFWRRWHLSLSTWLRDNLYIPLGGNRRGLVRTYVNLLLVMLLGGLWHGASWNFVIWGAIHGVLLAIERATNPHRRLPAFLRTAVTFLLTCFAWVFFRAESLPRAVDYFRDLFGLRTAQAGGEYLSLILRSPYYLISLAAAACIVWLCPQTWDFTRRLDAKKCVLCLTLLAISLILMEAQAFNPFIYFIF